MFWFGATSHLNRCRLGEERWREELRKTAEEGEGGRDRPWFHASRHKLPVGTQLVPVGEGRSVQDPLYRQQGAQDRIVSLFLDSDAVSDALALGAVPGAGRVIPVRSADLRCCLHPASRGRIGSEFGRSLSTGRRNEMAQVPTTWMAPNTA